MMGRVLLLALMLIIPIAAACANDAEAPTHTPGATPAGTTSDDATSSPTASVSLPTETASPIATPVRTFGTPSTDFADFREFAAEIDTAAQAANADFFLRDPVIDTVDCSFMGCPSGTYSGVDFGGWLSEASPYPIDAVRENLAAFLEAQGKLFGIAAVHSDQGGAIGGPATFAILTSNVTTSAPIRVLEFILDSDQWRLKLVMEVVATGDSKTDWLSGTCAECYDYFEPWQGAAP